MNIAKSMVNSQQLNLEPVHHAKIEANAQSASSLISL
jgi:hypothetical protein